jgi:predicted transcriptional regulator
MTDQTKIYNLDEKEEIKNTLAYLIKPKKLPEIAVNANIAYSTAQQRLSILVAKGYVKKIKTVGGKTLFQLSDKVIP